MKKEEEVLLPDGLKVGDRFGLWTILGFNESTAKPWKKRRYFCQCDCGTIKTVGYHDLIQKRRGSRSCGCRGRQMHRLKTGDQFNRWTVIREVKKRDNKRMMECRCSCGWLGQVRVQDLVQGRSRSCGCLRDEEQSLSRKGKMPEYVHGKRMKKVSSPFICYGYFEDLAGQKFNRWTVIKRVQNNNDKKVTYQCECDCGWIGNVPARDLKTGHSKSCGCLRLEHLERLNASGGNRRRKKAA